MLTIAKMEQEIKDDTRKIIISKQLVVQQASMSVKLFFVLFVVICELSNVLSGPAVKSNYIEQENSCRDVCGLCDCDGFYCEDECICECSIKDEDNLQCIADMKTECDKNGLEYELLMQEETKDRFLRQIRPNMMPFEKLSKNLVIIKKKREDSTAQAAPIAEEPKPIEDPIVGSSHSAASSSPSLPHLDFSNLHLDNIHLPNFENLQMPNFDNLQMPNFDNLQLPNLDLSNIDFSHLNLGDIHLGAPAPPQPIQPIQFPANFEPGRLLMDLRTTTTAKPTDPPARTFPTIAPISFPPITMPSNMPSLIVQPSHLF